MGPDYFLLSYYHGVIGETAAHLGHLEEAEKALQRAVEIDPGYGPARYRRGTLREESGDDAGAIEDLFEGEVAGVVLTDPPYNVKVEPRSNNAIAASQLPATRNTITATGLRRLTTSAAPSCASCSSQ